MVPKEAPAVIPKPIKVDELEGLLLEYGLLGETAVA